MKLVNLTNRNIYVTKVGTVHPGKKTPDLYSDLEKAMSKVVDMCGKNFGIDLSEKELSLIDKIMDLAEAGEKFDPASVPEDVRKDPLGKKKAMEAAKAAQKSDIEADRKANVEGAAREALINGEISERKPVGPATMKGEKVEPSMLKSGFESILEENARIASKDNKPSDPKEMLDPIGAHMKKEGVGDPTPAEGKGIGDAKPVSEAKGREDDAVRTADASVPKPAVDDRAGAMDRQAAETARRLSTIGPVDEPHTDNPEDPDNKEDPDYKEEEADNKPAKKPAKKQNKEKPLKSKSRKGV